MGLLVKMSPLQPIILLSAIAVLCAVSGVDAKQRPPQAGASRSSETCGRADPGYIRIANETGGQPLFFKPSEAGRIGQFMRELSGANHELLLWTTATLDRNPQQFTVPVDANVERLTFALSVNREGSTLTIVRPSGAPVGPGDTDVEMTQLACSQVVTISGPQSGEWRADIRGAGTFWLQVGARTGLFLSSVNFVKPGGRPGHEGLFPIAGQPLLGSPVTLRATLNGATRAAGFRLVTLTGETIAPVTMDVIAANDDDHEYVGTFQLPREAFRFAAIGEDAGGHPYQRVFHTLFHGETVEISSVDGTPDTLPSGETTTVTFAVRNIGQAATFRIVVVDSRQFVTNVNPRELTVQTDSSGNVTVDLFVPPNAPTTSRSTVTITASSITGPSTANAAVKNFDVVAAARDN